MEINSEIKDYVQQNIILKYRIFDKAHNLEHVEKVIASSLSIAHDYEVDINKVYIIAAYHDIGLSQGRKEHEKTSAAFLRSDTKLKRWFSEDEIDIMSNAVEDHRASNDYEPRSIYGKIVSEADRDIEYWTILTRAVQYGLENHPDFNFEQHLMRTYEHIKDKYGENGYLKLWLNTDKNRQNLQMLRNMTTSKETLRPDFEKIFCECTK